MGLISNLLSSLFHSASDNSDYICDECGGRMEPADDTVLVCTECGHSVDIEDYGHEHDYDDYYASINDEDDDIPEGCLACGGPYPDCTSSCPLFDD